MSKFNKVAILLGVLLLADLVTFGIVVFYDREMGQTATHDLIRLGITPRGDRHESDISIEKFFHEYGNQEGFELRSCYTTSYEEAIYGFTHGIIDILYINPAYFLVLKRQFNARALAFQRYSREERDMNHAVLVSKTKISDIAKTRGMRMLFSSKYSMSGYMIPARFLELSISMPLKQWFSSIEHASSDHQSLSSLIAGKTDIAACELANLTSNEEYKRHPEQFHILWISPKLPEALICVSFKSEFYDSKPLAELVRKLWEGSIRESAYNRNSMVFEPVNHQYEQQLTALEGFLFGNPDQARR